MDYKLHVYTYLQLGLKDIDYNDVFTRVYSFLQT